MQLLQQWHVPNTSEKLDTAVLFDQVKISIATSKIENIKQLTTTTQHLLLLNMHMLKTCDRMV